MYTTMYPKIVLRMLVVACLILISSSAAGSGQESTRSPQDQDYRFRPDHERLEQRGKSAYVKFQEQEGVPVYTGWFVDVYAIALKPWKRLGAGISGAYINLEGAGAVVDSFCMEIAAGAKTNPVHHLFEEQILILDGEGETHIWQKDPAKKVVIPWRKGTVFSPPLNAWHQHFAKGGGAARLVTVTDLPLKLDLFRNTDFIFGANFDFTDRYAGQADYFDPENSKDYAPLKSSHSLSVVNLVRNAWTWRLFHAGQGYHDIDRHFVLSANTMTGHIEQFPVGTYERAHRHGPSSTIVLLNGTGYSLMWPSSLGTTPWKDGKGEEVQRVDWRPGIMVIPPVQWFHQHFNDGTQPARFIKLGGTPGNEIYPMSGKTLEGGDRYTVLFEMEDHYVRQLFEKELAEKGAKIQMPSREELVELERKSGYGPLTVP